MKACYCFAENFPMRIDLSVVRKIVVICSMALAGVILSLAFSAWKKGPAQKVLQVIPDYGSVPPFSLIERDGRHVRLFDLNGQVWIVDFIFTTCPGPCPVMTSRMRRLQSELKDKNDIRLVSVSVDPETDTPEVLSKYARGFGADSQRWLFLTGSRDAIHALATDGLHLVMERNTDVAPVPGQGPIVHSTRFVLVDRRSHIRGYYDSTDEESMHRLVGDVGKLLEEKSS